MTTHQNRQLAVIDQIDQQINNNKLSFTTVSPVSDYEHDKRICLTSLHFPNDSLIKTAQRIISQLKAVEPNYYYYDSSSLHLTIKNIKVINDPPQFDESDISKVKKIFSSVIPHHHKFKVYFYRLLLLPNNVSLIATTDPELDDLVLHLDNELNKAGVPDDKVYSNKKYFFINMTLARFDSATPEFAQTVKNISQGFECDPYTIDTVSLVTGNAVFKTVRIVQTWHLM